MALVVVSVICGILMLLVAAFVVLCTRDQREIEQLKAERDELQEQVEDLENRPSFHALLLERHPQYYDVFCERQRQDAKWGEQNRTPDEWLLILQEEIGEFSQAVLDARYGGKPRAPVREELVQAVAVALAMLEDCDRNEWHIEKSDEPINLDVRAPDEPNADWLTINIDGEEYKFPIFRGLGFESGEQS